MGFEKCVGIYFCINLINNLFKTKNEKRKHGETRFKKKDREFIIDFFKSLLVFLNIKTIMT